MHMYICVYVLCIYRSIGKSIPTNERAHYLFVYTFTILTPHVHTHTDLEWKVLYVGSAHDAQYDQILDEILVGPVPVGLNKFVLQADAPNVTQLVRQQQQQPPNNNRTMITSDDILGVTVVLVTCSYKEREFVRIGYYVNNEYQNPFDDDITTSGNDMILDGPTAAVDHQDGPPLDDDESPTTTPLRPKMALDEIDFSRVQRHILADKPRVTKFPISWNTTGSTNDDEMAKMVLPKETVAAMSNTTPSTTATLDDDDDDERRMEC